MRLEHIDLKINEIYLLLYGKPKTHQEWANSFNIKWKIKKVLIK
jgi:hypothetical protein